MSNDTGLGLVCPQLHPVTDGAKFCPECGAPLVEPDSVTPFRVPDSPEALLTLEDDPIAELPTGNPATRPAADPVPAPPAAQADAMAEKPAGFDAPGDGDVAEYPPPTGPAVAAATQPAGDVTGQAASPATPHPWASTMAAQAPPEADALASRAAGPAAPGPAVRPTASPMMLSPVTTVPLRPASRKTPSRKRWLIVAAIAAVVALIAGVVAWQLVPTSAEKLVAQLRAANLMGSFPSDDVAVAQSEAFCRSMTSGAPNTGYRWQQMATDQLCPQFSLGFTVIPTPEEQQASLTSKLRESGLGGTSSSDAAAVAAAKAVCAGLDAGGKQQGDKAAAIAVSVYCPKYAPGFTTLSPIDVQGTMTLIDSSPSLYYSSISSYGGSCEGTGGYSDIHSGTEVVVKDTAGKTLTTTTLGSGNGTSYECTLPFSFTVMDGADGYVITISHRGDLHYTASDLKTPGRVSISLGD